ncbi:hypothetical protein WN48_05749 [Eufriesea mexicana]|uniref:Uncharacterized protein n=1 Tax=Eufriesea mexicana TaxID=516756 RepID=A0A310S909_9HYME|nr:hypothetical protein WN48_05749 [Eufriesea mexicana]
MLKPCLRDTWRNEMAKKAVVDDLFARKDVEVDEPGKDRFPSIRSAAGGRSIVESSHVAWCNDRSRGQSPEEACLYHFVALYRCNSKGLRIMSLHGDSSLKMANVDTSHVSSKFLFPLYTV